MDFRTYTDGLVNTSCQKLTKCIDSASDDGGLFQVLNAHATMVAQGKPLSDDLKIAFNSFLVKVGRTLTATTKQGVKYPSWLCILYLLEEI